MEEISKEGFLGELEKGIQWSDFRVRLLPDYVHVFTIKTSERQIWNLALAAYVTRQCHKAGSVRFSKDHVLTDTTVMDIQIEFLFDYGTTSGSYAYWLILIDPFIITSVSTPYV